MKGALGSKLAHLRAVGSVSPLRLAARVAPLPLEQRFGGGRALAPIAITLEITNRCNLDCHFCFLKPEVLNSGGPELTTEEVLGIVEHAAQVGAGLYVTGGEPLVRPDLPEIVAGARARGVRVGINTNGVLLAGRRGERLLEAEPDYLLISPHSLDAGTDTRRAERDGIRAALRRRGRTRVLLNAVLGPDPAEDVVQLAEEMGADGVTFQHPTFFTPEQRHAHAEVWTRVTGEPDPGLAGPDDLPEPPAPPPTSGAAPVWVKPDLSAQEWTAWYADDAWISARCHYPWTDLRVQPNGDVVFCQFIERRLGNVRERPLGEIWNDAAYRHLRRSLLAAGGSYPGCARCCKLYRASSRELVPKPPASGTC